MTKNCTNSKKDFSKTLGILVGGGPAPGINGAISAATIEAINHGFRVLGIMDGFKWFSKGDNDHIINLTIEDVSRIHFSGGSVLRTSRDNPTTDPEKLQNVVKTLFELGVNYLITIGGDDTAYSSSKVEKETRGKIKVAHIPKTIDNDLPLPNYAPSFGYETARHYGVEIIQCIMEDAKTTNRWYFIVTMGRKAGHLALGIGKASGATLSIIAEEFRDERIRLSHICDIIEGSIIKRKSMGRDDGVVVLAEGLSEKLAPEELEGLKDVERDEHGHIRLAEIDLGKVLKQEVRRRLYERGIRQTIVSKDIGYELRCSPPIPFDCEYTRDLGYGAIKFLLEGDTGAIMTRSAGRIIPLYFSTIITPETGKIKLRLLDITTESYEVACKYMIRLNKQDFEDCEQLKRLAKAGNFSVEDFKNKFSYLSK